MCAEAEQAGRGNVAEVTVVPEFLTCKRIAQVNFDERNTDCEQRIAKRHASVGKGARVEDDEIDASGARLLDEFDQFVLGIALAAFELVPEFPRNRGRPRLDVATTRRNLKGDCEICSL